MTPPSATPPSSAGRRRALTEKMSDLAPRVLSGLALGAVGAGALYLGGWVSALLTAVAVFAMGWEYRAVTAASAGGFRRRDAFFPALVALAPVIAHLEGRFAPAMILLLGGVIATVGLDRGGGRDWRWTAPGMLILGGGGAAFVFLRDQPQFGLATAVWLVLVVVGTDVGGYFAGRLIGGPKLAPTLSPGKTWAGLFGGMALAFLIGGLFSWATTGTYAQEVCAVSLAAALVAQMGDLAESWLKRRFGVKDSGALLPGHGGAMDRLDGLIAATLVVAAVTFARGREVFVW